MAKGNMRLQAVFQRGVALQERCVNLETQAILQKSNLSIIKNQMISNSAAGRAR
jgi:hypothetical protein